MTLLQRQGRSEAAAPSSAILTRIRVLAVATVAGGLAAFLSALVVVVPVLIAWFADERSTAPVADAVTVGLDGWALAHRATVSTGGADLVLAPLLLTALPVLVCRYAVQQVLVDRPEVRGPVARIAGAPAAWRAIGGTDLLAFVIGYAAAGVLLCTLTAFGPWPVQTASALPGLLLVPLLGVALGLSRERRAQEQPTITRGLRWVEAHTPVLVRRGLGLAREAGLALAVIGLLVVVAAVVLRWERMGVLYDALDAGVVGITVMSAAQLLALPNLLLWALGWVSGAGSVVGSVHLDWSGTTAGELPLVPVLAVLPEPGPMPPWAWVAGLLPVLVGGWVGWRGAGSAPRLSSWWTKARIAGSACLALSLGAVLLTWLASGGLVPGRLAAIGSQPWQVGGWLLAELLLGAVLVVTTVHLTRRRL